jgi:hypothetical protein
MLRSRKGMASMKGAMGPKFSQLGHQQFIVTL